MPAPVPSQPKPGAKPAAAKPAPKPEPKPAPKPEAGSPTGGEKKREPVAARAEKKGAAPALEPKPPEKEAKPVKAKAADGALPTSHPRDPAERNADAVAEKVMKMGTGPGPAGDPKAPGVAPVQDLKAVPREVAPDAGPRTVQDPEGPKLSQERIRDLGPGQPLDPQTRAFFEQRFGTSLGHVRVHTDGQADAAATSIQARAFTLGNRIGFAAGEYQPGTPEGQRLIAHELAHVLQQGESEPVPRTVMRDGPAPTGTPPASGGGGGAKGNGTLRGGKLYVPKLQLPQKPGLEGRFLATRPWPRPDAEERTNQIEDWKKQIQPSAAGWDMASLIGPDNQLPETTGAPQYALKLASGSGGQGYVIGTEAGIRDLAVKPWWDTDAAPHQFDVDHILELQLGGSADQLENFQLLDSSANRSSGSRIAKAMNDAIRAAIPPEVEGGGTLPDNLSKPVARGSSGGSAPAASGGAGGATAPAPAAAAPAPAGGPPGAGGAPGAAPATDAMGSIKKSYEIYFDEVVFSGNVSGAPGVCWSGADVVAGKHLKVLQKATSANSPDLFAGDKIKVFPRPGAGVMFTAPLPPGAGQQPFGSGTWGGMAVTGGTFDRAAGNGTINVTLPKTRKVDAKNTALPIVSAGVPTLCHIPPGAVMDAYRSAFSAKTLSPIELSTAEMDAGANIAGGGRLTIDGIPLFAGVVIDVSLAGGDLVFSKTFTTDDVKLKGPIQIDSCSLTLSVGMETPIGADGVIEFHIGELAKGTLTGSASAAGFALDGELTFEQKLFTGTGRVHYDSENGLTASGTLGLKPGALKGVKKADFTLAYDDNAKSIDFAGNAELAVPGFKGARIAAHADEAGNVSLAGEATLSDAIPRVKAGKLSIAAKREGDNWSLGGGGELEPDLSGLDASAKIKVDYDDGILTGKLNAQYKRGMAAGSVELNAKAAVGEGGGEAEPFKVWGSGRVEVTPAPWIKASVGLVIDEKGELTISGEVGLPSKIEIFPRKEVNKSLFSLATQIPIIPGIVAEVGGNLSATAGIGPGSLDQLRIGLEYNPDHEENTHITGDVHMSVPADAGLRLAARAGIGLGITGASATGGIEIGGTLGIAGAAEASAHIDWTPGSGLAIDAEAYIHAEPRFKFDISGYVAVTVVGMSVYDNRWELASVEIGSNLRLGIRFPVHYEQGQDFNVSLDDVTFEVPEVSASSLIDQVGAKLF